MPATILTGFLGSGKTTLLRRALGHPGFADTAVIINEIGEIAIDHYLVDFVDGNILELPGGCLCCAVREDLAQTLRDLIERRDAGEIRAFRRIAIETSGLADPGPILFTLGTDAMLDRRLRLERIVTVVDAASGAATIDRFAEAARQVAVADAIVVSKTDLAPFGPDLVSRLDTLNPTAERIMASPPPAGEVASAASRRGQRPAPDAPSTMRRMVPLPRCAGEEPAVQPDPAQVLFAPPLGPRPAPLPLAGEEEDGLAAAHTHGVRTFAIALGTAPSRFDFARALGGLAQQRGYDLLRVKGLVAFADQPERPAAVHAAQHAMFAPEWLDDWPDADRRSRLVFVVHDISPDEILAHFAFAAPALIGRPVHHRSHS